jgi:fatty-acyl-CoA synthase
VIGVPDPVYEERAVAYVRRQPGTPEVAAAELLQFIRARLAGFKTPRELHFVDDFPRTGMGKIAKGELAKTQGSVFGDA